MAAVWRALARQGREFARLPALRRQLLTQPVCFISTSKKNKDVSVAVQPMEKSAELKKLEEHFANTDRNADKNWTSYGYEDTDPVLDNFAHHVTMFMYITVCICWGGFILAYMPDHKLEDWCNREAYLELERRETLGLPLVDPNLIPPENFNLPSDEELGDQEIII